VGEGSAFPRIVAFANSSGGHQEAAAAIEGSAFLFRYADHGGAPAIAAKLSF
jgi:hypothetical protein